MATDTHMYQNREMRDLAWETEKARGSRGVTRRTDQINGKMVYILSVPIKDSVQILHDAQIIENNSKLDLTTNENGENMASEGNPNV